MHIEGADDAGEQVVEVVGDAAGELAHRLHLLRLAQLLLGALALLHLGVQALVGGLKLGRALGDPPLEQPFGLDVLADIDVGAEPADDPPLLVADRHDLRQERPEHAIRALERKRHLERLARGEGVLPARDDARQLLGVVHRLPAPPFLALGGGAGVFVPAPVVPEDVPVGVSDPAQRGDIVGERIKLLAAQPQRLPGRLALGDVDRNGENGERSPGGVTDRAHAIVDPNGGPVRAAVTLFDLERLASLNRALEQEGVARQVIGMRDVLRAHPDQLFTRAADDLAVAVVHAQEPAVEILFDETRCGLAEDRAEPLLAVAQALLGPAALIEFPLRGPEEPGVVDGDRRLRRHADHQPLVARVEHGRARDGRRTSRRSPRPSAT